MIIKQKYFENFVVVFQQFYCREITVQKIIENNV